MAERDDLTPEQIFLKPFEARALAQALTDWGHKVHYKTVERWKNGKTPIKAGDVAAIRLMVAGVDTEKPPPWWEAAYGDLVAEIQENRDTISRFVEDQARKDQSALVIALRKMFDEFLDSPTDRKRVPPAEAPQPNGRSRNDAANGRRSGQQPKR